MALPLAPTPLPPLAPTPELTATVPVPPTDVPLDTETPVPLAVPDETPEAPADTSPPEAPVDTTLPVTETVPEVTIAPAEGPTATVPLVEPTPLVLVVDTPVLAPPDCEEDEDVEPPHAVAANVATTEVSMISKRMMHLLRMKNGCPKAE